MLCLMHYGIRQGFPLGFYFQIKNAFNHTIDKLPLLLSPVDRPIKGDVVKLVNLVYWRIIVKSHDQNSPGAESTISGSRIPTQPRNFPLGKMLKQSLHK